jgi:hypothetical protein
MYSAGYSSCCFNVDVRYYETKLNVKTNKFKLSEGKRRAQVQELSAWVNSVTVRRKVISALLFYLHVSLVCSEGLRRSPASQGGSQRGSQGGRWPERAFVSVTYVQRNAVCIPAVLCNLQWLFNWIRFINIKGHFHHLPGNIARNSVYQRGNSRH